MKYLALLILMLSFVSSSCIDINSASLSELDKIIWVGPATAQKIIDARPFDDVNDLDKVSGIGDAKIADIEEEGLACVNSKKEDEEIYHEKVVDDVSLEEGNSILAQKEKYDVLMLNNINYSEEVYASKNDKIISWLPYAFSLFLILIIAFLLLERF
jgi:hypothetical protein